MDWDKVYEYETRVYTEDVDYMRIVYHANYLRYFERARTEFLRQNNLILSELLEMDVLFAISEVNIRYLAPAKLDDLLKVTTKARQERAYSFVFEQELVNQHHAILSTAVIQAVCVNKNLKPKRFLQK